MNSRVKRHCTMILKKKSSQYSYNSEVVILQRRTCSMNSPIPVVGESNEVHKNEYYAVSTHLSL